MKSVLICFFGSYFASLANSVSGLECEQYPVHHEVLNAPLKFGFLSLSTMNILIILKNVPPTITDKKLVVETDDPVQHHQYEWNRDKDYFRLCGDLKFSKVTIYLQLYTSNGLCATKVVSEGRHAKILENGLANQIYKSTNLCFEFSTCGIEMDLRNYCIESKTDARPPKATPNIPHTTRNTSVTRKPKISDTSRATENIPHTTRNTTATRKPKISDTSRATENIPHTTRNTWVSQKPHISDTSKATENIPHTTRNTAVTRKPKISDTSRATENIPHTTRNTSITQKPKISDTSKATENIPHITRNTSVTQKPKISDTPKTTENVTDTRNISNTSNATFFIWYDSDTPLNLLDTLIKNNMSGQNVDITPLEAVRRIGDQLKVLCKVPYPIDSCRMTVGGIPYRLIPDNLQGDVVYAGQGLEAGECGALIKNIKADWNGKISCVLVPSLSGYIKLVGTMRLQVEHPPKRQESGPITIFGLKLGAEGRLNVTVRANPKPSAEWTAGDQVLAAPRQSDNGQFTALEPLLLGNGYYNITLVLARITKEDVDRTYFLRVDNGLGREEFAIRISTMDEPADTINKKHTIAIISATISGMVFILLAIAIWKRCWVQRNPLGTHTLQSNNQNNPFYVNLLFRRECEQEIEIIDQHHYEEINYQSLV